MGDTGNLAPTFDTGFRNAAKYRQDKENSLPVLLLALCLRLRNNQQGSAEKSSF